MKSPDGGPGAGGTTGAGGTAGTAGEGGTAGSLGVAGDSGTGGTGGAIGAGGSSGGASGGKTGTGGKAGSGVGGTGGTAGAGGSGGTAGTGAGGRGGTAGTGAGGSGGTAGTGAGGRGGGSAGTGGGTCVPVTMQLLKNPSFDSVQNVDWIDMSGLAGSTVITTPVTGLPPQTAPNVAWEGGYDNATDDLYQDVMIPANATSITFSFYYFIATQEYPGAGSYDFLDAYVFDPTTNSTFTIVTELSNEDETSDWTLFTGQVPLSWAGGLAEFGFMAITDDVNNTNFFVDTTSVTVTYCP